MLQVEWATKEHHLLGYFPDSAWKGPFLTSSMKLLQQAVAEVRTTGFAVRQELTRKGQGFAREPKPDVG